MKMIDNKIHPGNHLRQDLQSRVVEKFFLTPVLYRWCPRVFGKINAIGLFSITLGDFQHILTNKSKLFILIMLHHVHHHGDHNNGDENPVQPIES